MGIWQASGKGAGEPSAGRVIRGQKRFDAQIVEGGIGAHPDGRDEGKERQHIRADLVTATPVAVEDNLHLTDQSLILHAWVGAYQRLAVVSRAQASGEVLA